MQHIRVIHIDSSIMKLLRLSPKHQSLVSLENIFIIEKRCYITIDTFKSILVLEHIKYSHLGQILISTF